MTHANRTTLASVALSLAIAAFGAACQPEAPASGPRIVSQRDSQRAKRNRNGVTVVWG